MRRFMSQRAVAAAAIGVAAFLYLSGRSAVDAADDAAVPATIKAQLDAGEFSGAFQAAQAIPAGPGRDAVLARIAGAQNQAGARGDAIATTFQMSGDQSRAARSINWDRRPGRVKTAKGASAGIRPISTI